jgi:hypothetical protein
MVAFTADTEALVVAQGLSALAAGKVGRVID